MSANAWHALCKLGNIFSTCYQIWHGDIREEPTSPRSPVKQAVPTFTYVSFAAICRIDYHRKTKDLCNLCKYMSQNNNMYVILIVANLLLSRTQGPVMRNLSVFIVCLNMLLNKLNWWWYVTPLRHYNQKLGHTLFSDIVRVNAFHLLVTLWLPHDIA